jgi:hypothetical protein
MLGTTTIPANNVYGVAFTINYDPTIVEAGSVNVDFISSWFGTNLLNIQYDFSQQGAIEVAVARRDRNNISGSGEIGKLNLTIQNDILRNVSTRDMNIGISNIRLIQNDNTVIGTNPQTGVVTVNLASSTENIEDFNLEIFPNPASAELNLKSTNTNIESVIVINLTGQILYVDKNVNSNLSKIDISSLAEGIYLIQVQTDKGLTTKKLVKK